MPVKPETGAGRCNDRNSTNESEVMAVGLGEKLSADAELWPWGCVGKFTGFVREVQIGVVATLPREVSMDEFLPVISLSSLICHFESS